MNESGAGPHTQGAGAQVETRRQRNDTPSLPVDELTDWALAVPIPSWSALGHARKDTGPDRARLVLVGLARHADASGMAWPASATLADRIGGMSRRDVRNGLELLAAAGLVVRAGRMRRAIRWRLLAGEPANIVAGEVAGVMAGVMAGVVAGEPATNRTEQNGTPPYPPHARQCEHGFPAGSCPHCPGGHLSWLERSA